MKYFILLSLLIFTGCATHSKYEAKLNTWTGRNINELIDRLGPPDNEFTKPDGNKMYTWMRADSDVSVSHFVGYQAFTTTMQRYCKTTFITDSSNTIVNWQYEGRLCKSR